MQISTQGILGTGSGIYNPLQIVLQMVLQMVKMVNGKVDLLERI